ncbi:MAG TPA: hypothetical protein VFQ60_02310 [Patescibacteria group bacterium]|nr:hypothetical protein [Patescibacteria group bacterium]
MLGKKGDSESKGSKRENFRTEVDDIHLSAGDQRRIEDERIFGEIIVRESQALRNFFGKEIPIPALPKQATKERILEWRRLGLELHYLPHISMAEIKRGPEGKILEVTPIEFPGWKMKPGTSGRYGNGFFDDVKSGDLDSSTLDLPGDWILIDAREKPNYDEEGNQMYANDPLAPVLEELRKEKIVGGFKIKGSRFALSPEELEDPKVLEAFARALNLHTIPGFTIGIPRAIEFNVLGNIHYPQWAQTNISEWFSDKYGGSGPLSRLYGGSGRLSRFMWNVAQGRSWKIGFRVIGRFSSNQEESHKK